MKNNRKSRSPKNWRDKFKEKLEEDHLRMLEEAVEHDGGLFRGTKEYEEYRKRNVRYRIERLLENDRNIDALAWLCLETELNPDNVEAIALKEQLKKKLYFTKEDGIEIKNSNNNPLFDWGPVAGMQDEKKFIERNILLPLKEKKIYKNFKVSIPNGIIFHGPPGCGKTFIVRQMARLLEFSFFQLTPSSIASTYVHGTQEKIESSFAQAREKKPALVFIDELEAFVPERSRGDVSFHYQAEVNEFLLQLDKAYRNGIFVVGATNHLDLIDDAVIRPGRFDKKLFIGPPDIKARIEAFKNGLRNRPHKLNKWNYLGEETKYYTFAEIKYVIDETARHVAADGKTRIDLNDLMKVILANPPQLTKRKLDQY